MPEENFWSTVGQGSKAYHATTEENAEEVKKSGLEPRCETRAISNKYMPCAVFASYNQSSIDAYGDIVFEIDLGLMKADGYIPEVSGEEPLEEAYQRSAIAYKLGFVEDFGSEYVLEGLDEDTIAIYGHIPPKYLKRISFDDTY